MCKKAAIYGESLHEREQLSRQWRNATKVRRKRSIDRELKEKACKRANEHQRFKGDRYKFAKELFDPPIRHSLLLVWMRLLRILWRHFFIHDFPPSFVSKELQCIQTSILRSGVDLGYGLGI